MADLNDLLEEAAARTVDLAKKASEASVALDALTTQASSLTELLSSEVGGIRLQLQSLAEALDGAGDALRTARAETVAELDAAAAQTGVLQSDAATVFADADRELDAAAQRRTQVRDVIDAAVEAARAELARVAEAHDAASESASTHFRAANEAALSFRQSRETGQQTLQTAHEKWTEAVAGLEGAAKAAADDWDAGLTTLGEGMGERAATLLERAGARSDEAERRVRDALDGGVSGALDSALEPNQQQIGLLVGRISQVYGPMSISSAAVIERSAGVVEQAVELEELVKAARAAIG